MRVNPRIRDLRDMLKLDARDMRELTRMIDQKFTVNERRLFSSEGRSGGEPWAPLSPAYAKAKRKRFPGRKILQREGTLRRSLVNRHDPRHVAKSTTKPRPIVTVGTRVRHGAYHAPGFFHNPRLPVRDPLAHTGAQMRGYLGVAAKYHIGKLQRVRRVLRAARF